MTLELLDALGAQISPDIVRGISEDSGAFPAEIDAAIEHAKPAMLAGIARLGSTPRGAPPLLSAATVAYRSGLLDKLRSFGTKDAHDLAVRGRPILEAIFGRRTSEVVVAVARSSGARPEIASRVLAVVAPIALAVVGRDANLGGLDPPKLSHLLASDERSMLALAPRELGPAPLPTRRRSSGRRRPLHLPHAPWALAGGIAACLAVLGVAWAGTPVASSATAAQTAAAPPQSSAPAPALAATREPAPAPASPEPTSQTTITSAEMPLTEIPLYEVHFAYDSTQIGGEDADTIRKIANGLIGEPKTQIRLTGHGDGIASADAEKQLGLERAESVQRRLVLLGVDPSHVEVTAAEPAPETATLGAPAAASGAQNRRVDISLVNE